MNHQRKRRRGLTLIEVLAVLLILGLLATIGIVALTGTQEQAKEDITKVRLKEVATALDLYHNAIGHYPTEAEGGLDALRTKPTFDNERLAEKWRRPFLKQEPLDAWDNPLNYEVADLTEEDTSTPPYRLWSNGADGQDGTDDDISYWREETTD